MANQSFWTTTSGMATGVAGTLTGLVAMAGIAAQAGWIGSANDSGKGENASATASTTTSTTPGGSTSSTSTYEDDRTGTTAEGGGSDAETTATSDPYGDDGTGGTSTTAAAGRPTYSVDPTTATFGALGERTRKVNVRNTGTVELVVQDIAVEGAGAGRFAVSTSPCTTAPVGPGRSCALEVNFTPPSSGEAEATLVIDVEDAPSREVPLAGEAIL